METDQITDELPPAIYWISALAISLIAIWDGYAESAGLSHRTVTEIIYLWSRRWPLVPFAAGMICGHLFWRKR